MATVLYVTAEVLRRVAIITQPVMPAAMTALLDLLSVPVEYRQFADIATQPLAAGDPLPAPQPIFPRYVEPEATA
jgi:methionyl-tRNA synthetase